MSEKQQYGRSDRIAVIHAVYGSAWAGLAHGAGLSIVATIVLVLSGLIVTGIAVVRLKQGRSASPDAPAIGSAITRINIVTAIAAVAAILILHWLDADRYLIPAVLAVMAIHFVPLWRLLRRNSLLVIGAVLFAAASLGFLGHVAMAAAVASLTFLINGARLSLRSP